jgi:hypothetical protein
VCDFNRRQPEFNADEGTSPHPKGRLRHHDKQTETDAACRRSCAACKLTCWVHAVTRQSLLNANQKVTNMKRSIVILALALELAVAATATAATAKSRAAQARAQAHDAVTENGASVVSPERVRALHECNARIASFKGYNGVNTPTSIYRSCMNDHGQPE